MYELTISNNLRCSAIRQKHKKPVLWTKKEGKREKKKRENKEKRKSCLKVKQKHPKMLQQ